MKKIFFVLCILISPQLLAECWVGFKIYPNKNEIYPNNYFMIEANLALQEVIDSLNEKYPIYLKDESSGHTVRLIVQEKLKGQDEITQAILKPVEGLLLNHKYSIHIDHLSPAQYEKFAKKDPETGRVKTKSWLVSKAKDITKPVFLKVPDLVAKETYALGNGNPEYAIFDLEIEDASEVLIKTTLMDVSTNQTYTFYLSVGKEEKLYVGHNICDGAFLYDKGKKYKVRFALLDLAGNSSEHYTKWTAFEAIFESDF